MSAKQQYYDTFSQPARASGRAWGRVNLIGEHLDYNGGLVLPAPIARFIDVAIGPSNSEVDEIHSNLFQDSVRRPLKFKVQGDWSDYVAATLALSRKLGFLSGTVNVSIDSDIPHGAGVSSSAALIVASLRAVLELNESDQEQAPDLTMIARWAQSVENDYIGVPCGIMDQIAVSVSDLGQAIALDTETLEHSIVDLPKDYHFVVVFSGVTRQLDESRYAIRRQECEAAAAQLNVPLLCKMSESQNQEIDNLPDVLARRARHVVSEHHRVVEAIDMLSHKNITRFGELMDLSHESMRDDFEITVPEIDKLVQNSRDFGAIGARMTGGGFGGCIVACVANLELDEWSQQLLAAHPAARIIA